MSYYPKTKLEDEKANKHLDLIILKVKYEGFFPNVIDEA